VDEQLALQAAGNHPLPDDVEVLAGLLLIPGGASGREGLQTHGGARRMARDAAGVTRALRHEDGLYLGFEKLEIQLSRCGRRARRLLDREANYHQDPEGDCQRQNSSPVDDP
jgi:hypothetical protein